jgi:hypothetical protein
MASDKNDVDAMAGSDGDDVEEISSPEMSPSKLKAALADKNILSGLEDQLNGLTVDPAAFVRSLPPPVKRRLKALKKLQYEHVKLESKFYEEVHDLECRFSAKYAALYDRRNNVLTGEVEPTDSECEWQSDEEDEDDEGNAAGGDTKQAKAVTDSLPIKGMPEFWLTALKNVGEVSELIQEHDEPILSALTDIRCVLSAAGEPMGFSLEFTFSPNDFFTNTVLTKKYNMKLEPTENDILYEGPEVISCEGCTIEWKAGKNVTVKVIKKKQKHKKSGVHRTVQKQVQNESFFNFFSPVVPVEEQEEPATEEIEAQLQSDFELAHFFREQIIPRAVLYYTGDAVDDESDEEYDEDDEDEDEDDEMSGPEGGLPNGGGPEGEKPQECKQQ